MTTIGDMSFSIHFMDGYWGREYKGTTGKHEEAYGRGYETSERESALAIEMERNNGNKQRNMGHAK